MGVCLRSVAAISALCALLPTCTGEPEPDLPDVVIGSTPESPDAPMAERPELPTHVGRLAVLDDRGNLVTVDPDGSGAVVLAEAIAGRTRAQQPTWSPDGTRLAWVELEAATEEEVVASLVTSSDDGTQRTRAVMPFAPFYLSWDPTSSRIAYLSPSSDSGIELGIVDVAGGGDEAASLDGGSPFYLSWDPPGEQLLVHVGTDRLERLEFDGTLTTVEERPGTFSAPVWTADGRSLVYASRTGDRQRLVVHDVGERRGRGVVSFEGGIRFVVSPDGGRIAFQIVGGPAEVEPLSVLDRETGTVEAVDPGPTLAFFWSPRGDRLLYLYPEADADRVWARWGVWDGETTFSTPRFTPTLVFVRDYLQFFEQYAQSIRLWAPDGSAFTYAGTSETGEQGIWVQPARADAEPVLVAGGVFAAWSPA